MREAVQSDADSMREPCPIPIFIIFLILIFHFISLITRQLPKGKPDIKPKDSHFI